MSDCLGCSIYLSSRASDTGKLEYSCPISSKATNTYISAVARTSTQHSNPIPSISI